MTIKAHFDGKVIVPDEPLVFPVNQKLRIGVVAEDELAGATAAHDRVRAI